MKVELDFADVYAVLAELFAAQDEVEKFLYDLTVAVGYEYGLEAHLEEMPDAKQRQCKAVLELLRI